jgi:hypothetical protein
VELSCGRFWGHNGGSLDYGTVVQASEDGDDVAVVSLHRGAFSVPPPDDDVLLCSSRRRDG